MTKKEHSLMQALLEAYIYPVGIYQSEYYGGNLEADVREALRNPICAPETNVELESAAARLIDAIRKSFLHNANSGNIALSYTMSPDGSNVKQYVLSDDVEKCVEAAILLEKVLRQRNNGPPVDDELPTSSYLLKNISFWVLTHVREWLEYQYEANTGRLRHPVREVS